MTETTDYSFLKQQLDNIIEKLNNEEISIDEAIELHHQAQKNLQMLEKYLKLQKNKVKFLD